MRKIIIILFLFFMFFVSICCESKQEARHARFETEQQKRAEYLHKLRKEENQQRFIHTRTSKVGRYEIFQDQQFAKNTFLFDTMDGRIWILTQEQETKELRWEEIDVKNRDTINVK